MVMRTIRVTTLLLLCAPGSAKEEELSAGLKAKLEQMGADSMAKQVRTPRPHTPTTTTAKAHPSRPIPLQAGVGGVAGFVGGYLVKYSQALHAHCTFAACSLHGRTFAACSHSAHHTHSVSHLLA